MHEFLEKRQHTTTKQVEPRHEIERYEPAEAPGGIFQLKLSTFGASPTYRTTFFDDGPRGDRYSPRRQASLFVLDNNNIPSPTHRTCPVGVPESKPNGSRHPRWLSCSRTTVTRRATCRRDPSRALRQRPAASNTIRQSCPTRRLGSDCRSSGTFLLRCSAGPPHSRLETEETKQSDRKSGEAAQFGVNGNLNNKLAKYTGKT